MNSIIIDSSTKILYICLVMDERVVFEKYVEGRNDHAKNIVYLVDKALETGNIDASDLDEIICGYGPGSYTGVRMAVTVAKMLAVFMNKPLYTISSLKLMASGTKGKVLSVIDARRGNVFGCILDTTNDTYIVNEAHTELIKLEENSFDFKVTDEGYTVNPFYVLAHKELVKEPHLLVPNYLRETEAERNLNA